ncbi:phytoene desaturase family protein [Photobacterium sp. SKA34]|uniref:phytoene desaturase family protein n=1 Tax=Photobacterium sp. SKA34 TaxID=121723 RepID=UPI000302F835|nr:phytoene desaturase family protein [Photobacterium sp. SKA34]
MKVVVMGAGFGGIASALRARALGFDVVLVEKNQQIGGRAQVFNVDGYRHDAGPTVITAPFLFDELFALFNRERVDYIEFTPLKVWYRFVFDDLSTFDYGGSQHDIETAIGNIDPSDVQHYRSLLQESKSIYHVGFERLADKPFHRMTDMMKLLPAMIKLKSYRSVWQLVSSHMQNEKLRQAFSIQPLLVGGNPFDTTSIYNLIHFLERKFGIHFAMGGTGALVKALEKLMIEQGIEIITNNAVELIETKDNYVKSLTLQDGTDLPCDHLISNIDPAYLYGKLLKKESSVVATVRTKLARKSMGLFVLFFGTNKQYSAVEHHTILLGKRFKGLLDDIFKHKVLTEDFSLYLHRPTATDPSFAPKGHDSFYALVPVPNLDGGQNWKEVGEKLKQRVIERLSQTLLPDLESHIQSAFYMTPEDFKDDYLSPSGAGFSISPHFYQSAWFRYHNNGEGLNNLSLAGAGTHPGAGLPGVLSSAKVVESLLKQKYGKVGGSQ